MTYNTVAKSVKSVLQKSYRHPYTLLAKSKMSVLLWVKYIQYSGQKCEDTKGVIRSHKSNDIQYSGQKCEDTKGVIRSHKSNRHTLQWPKVWRY